MERLTNKREADQQRKNYEKRLEQGYPRNIPEERFLKLAYYEDMEEQGRLKILPFAVGDTVYQIKRMTNAESKRAGVRPDYEGRHGERSRVVYAPNRPYKIIKREATKSMVNEFGKTVFLTREEAEQALATDKNDGRKNGGAEK